MHILLKLLKSDADSRSFGTLRLVNMVLANLTGPYLPPLGVPQVQLMLLQVLNQLQMQNSGPMSHLALAGSSCRERLEYEERRRRQNVRRWDEEHANLHRTIVNMQQELFEAASTMEDIKRNAEQRLLGFSKKFEEEIKALNKQLEVEKSVRTLCENELALKKDCAIFEHLKEGLHQLQNGTADNSRKIEEIFTAFQQMASESQKLERDKVSLEAQIKFANASLEVVSNMHTRQTKELENERRKNQLLQEQNAVLQTSLQNMLKDIDNKANKALEELQKSLSLLQNRKENETEVLTSRLEEETKTLNATVTLLLGATEKLVNTGNGLLNERNKNAELQRIIDENQNIQRDWEKQKAELLEAERRNCSSQLQQQKSTLESKLQLEEKKVQEVQSLLENCKGLLENAKAQNDVDGENVTKIIDFLTKHRKYLGSGTLKYAIAEFGSREIKEIFHRSGAQQITKEAACSSGFSCGNGRCIPSCFKCDGTDDCGNRKDETECSTAMFPIGMRVVRGEDWMWGDQDGIPPSVGTVIEESKKGGWTRVDWDNGHHRNVYRTGEEGKFELRAAAGYFCEAT